MPTDQTITAWVAQGGGALTTDSFVEVNRPIPELRARDLLVRVEAVSVNPVDTKVRSGLGAGDKRQLGYDAAGTVIAIGARVSRFAVGDEVWYAGDISRDGTNAELHAVDERIVGRKPMSLNWAEAAALPLTTITAWESLFDRMQLTRDSRGALLVMAGAGGVGSILIQLAKRLTDISVVATAGRPESVAWAREMGADHVVGRTDLIGEVRAAVPDGIDWVFSPNTRGNIDAFAELVNPFGHVVAIDEPAGLDIVPLKSKSIAFDWELMFTRPLYETPDMGEQGRLLDQVARLVDDGALRTTATTVIDGLNPLSLYQAHEIVGSGEAVGKVVIRRV